MLLSVIRIVGSAGFLGGVVALITGAALVPTFVAIFWGAIFGTVWARVRYKPAEDSAASESFADDAAENSEPDPAEAAPERKGCWGRIVAMFWGTVALAIFVVPMVLWFAAEDGVNSPNPWIADASLAFLGVGMTIFCVLVTWDDLSPPQSPAPPARGKQVGGRSPEA